MPAGRRRDFVRRRGSDAPLLPRHALTRGRPWLSAALAAFRPGATTRMLLDEDVCVELGHPEAALGGALEVTQRRPDIGLDAGPEEARVLLRQVGRIPAAEALGDADLAEFVIEGRQLPQIGRVGELA